MANQWSHHTLMVELFKEGGGKFQLKTALELKKNKKLKIKKSGYFENAEICEGFSIYSG